MRQTRSEACLADEPLANVAVCTQVFCEDFQRDRAAELRVAREVDDSHAPMTERVLDDVAAAGNGVRGQSPSPS